MTRTLAQLQDHFESLCEELHVEFAYHDDGLYGESYALLGNGQAWVAVPALDSTAAYYIALHELGHTTQPSRMPAMTREWDAWTGALEVSITKPTKETWRRIAYSMTTYAASYADRRFKIDQRFYDLLAWVLERRDA